MILPDIAEAQYAWFAVALFVSMWVAILVSPRRRRIIGTLSFLAARLLIAGPALFAAVCVRGGYALALQERGLNGALAQAIGIAAGMVFLILARIVLMLFPPSARLLKEWRRANWEASPLRRALNSKVD